MTTFRLLTYNENEEAVAAVLVHGQIYPVRSLLQDEEVDASSVLALLQTWEKSHRALVEAIERLDPSQGKPLDKTALLSPILYPNAIYCAAANFRDHMHAMAVKLNQPDEPDPRELDIKPYHFTVPARLCIAGPQDPIQMPSHGENIDWEIELVAVIGKTARQVSIDKALDYVAAYAVGNDVSVRDMRFLKIPNVSSHSLFRNDFIALKGFDKSCVVGPWLTMASDIPDPQQLAMKLWVDDELMQDSSTGEMVFTVAEQISYLSSRVTLLPGDIIMTGTPAGTGMERDRFLRPGETVRMNIESLGEMTQHVVDKRAGSTA